MKFIHYKFIFKECVLMNLKAYENVVSLRYLFVLLLIGGFLLTEQVNAQINLNENAAFVENEQNTIEIVNRYGPSVVAVHVTVEGEPVTSENFERFFENLPPEFQPHFRFEVPNSPRHQEGAGSGFVINKKGQIVTNYHVVEGTLKEGTTEMLKSAEVYVTFAGSENEFSAKVVGVNSSYDLALLELENSQNLPKDIIPIPIANSDEIQVGQKVIAIGNPFGLESTVTTGIVSAVGRDVPSVGRLNVPMVQTDAAINPGNSGGPLLNSSGKLIGINTAIIPSGGIAGRQGFLGIGFAVPSKRLSDNLEALASGGYSDVFSSRPRIGANIMDVQVYPKGVRESLKLPEHGLMITNIAEGGPADKAGLKGSQFEVIVNGSPAPAGGDVIVAIDDEKVTSATQVQDLVFNHKPNDRIVIEVMRDGESVKVPVVLEVVPLEHQAQTSNSRKKR